MQASSHKKICIIGAGPRGLVAARHLSSLPDTSVTVCEAQEDIGGVWLYKDMNIFDPNFDEHKEESNFYKLYKSLPNSIYPSLVTDVPYFFMEFKDLGMKDVNKDVTQFIDIPQFKQYLDAYTEKFGLRKLIHFNTSVSSVRLYNNLDENEKQKLKTDRKFLVKTIPSRGDITTEAYHDFDYIVVACGQYCVPYIPEIMGSEKFKGNILHCKDYRTPNNEIFQGKKVVILGGSVSSTDMLIQLLHNEKNEKLKGCEKVMLCSKKATWLKISDDFKPYIESGKLTLHTGTIAEIKENSAVFSDGSEEQVDTIVFATGYKFKFPYFDYKKDKIIDHEEDKHRGAFFGPVYKRIVAIREPSVFFVGFIGMTTLVHIIPELQSIAIKYLIEGKLKLPSEEEMTKDFNQKVQDHLEHVGDLAHFYKTNLTPFYPGLKDNFDMIEWKKLSEWLKPYHPNNNEEKAQQYYKVVGDVIKVLVGYYIKSNYASIKNENYLNYYPEDFRNTSDFV